MRFHRPEIHGSSRSIVTGGPISSHNDASPTGAQKAIAALPRGQAGMPDLPTPISKLQQNATERRVYRTNRAEPDKLLSSRSTIRIRLRWVDDRCC